MLNNLRRALSNVSDIDSDDVLEKLGLESRRSGVEKVLPTLAIFGAGVLVGVGVGLLLAPKPGAQLRDDLQSGLLKGQRKVAKEANGLLNDSDKIPAPSPAPVRPDQA